MLGSGRGSNGMLTTTVVDTEPAVSKFGWKEGRADLQKRGDAGTT